MANINLNTNYGMAMAAGLASAYPTTGKVFVVAKSAAASADILRSLFIPDYDGVSRFFTTLGAVVAVASRGDVIYIAPGHTETFSSATAITLSVAGVKIVGLGFGADRPTFTLDTANTATINITANSIQFVNCIFVANFLAIASLFTLTTATDFQLMNCEFRDTSSVLNFVAIVTTATTSNAADGLLITNCKRIGAGASTNTTIVSMLGTNNRMFVKDNYFNHAATTAAGFMIIATGKVVTNLEAILNVFLLVGASNLATGLLVTTNGSTNSGYFRSNYIQTLDDTAPILVTASSGFRFYDNKVSSNADASGYLVPTVDT